MTPAARGTGAPPCLIPTGAYYPGSMWGSMLWQGGADFETPPPLFTREGMFKPYPPTGARVAAPGNVADHGPRSPHSTRSQHSFGPTDPDLAIRLPPGCDLARAMPGVFSTRAEFSPARRPAERCRPALALAEARDFGRRGPRSSHAAGGRRGRVGDG
jgi:hypothetical protein